MRVLALLTTALLLACTPPDREPPEPNATIRTELREGVELYAHPGGVLEITGRYTAGDIEKAGRAAIPVTRALGFMTLDPDEQLWLEDLEFELGDVVVTPYTLPIHLTDLKVTVEGPVNAMPRFTGFDLGTLELHAETTLWLEWAMVTENGTAAMLGPQRLGPLPIVVAVRLDADFGFVMGDVRIATTGEVWNWAGVLHLEDPDAAFEVADQPYIP